MSKYKNIILTSLIALSLGFLTGVIAGLVIGINISKKSESGVVEKEVITSTVVLEKVQEQAFLITRTVITDQDVEIIIDQGSAWSNFWWGHEVNAEGIVQVDVGIDLAAIKESDIVVDDENKTITILLPEAEVYDSSLKGEITVSKESGWFKQLFDNDDNEDYNLAMNELTSKAQTAVEEDSEMMKEAQESALLTLQAILKDTGYEIVITTGDN